MNPNDLADKSTQNIAPREQHFLAITDAMPGLTAYWDKELRCGFANTAYQEWFGKTSDAIIGITIKELLGEQLFSLNEPYILGVLSGKQQNFEHTIIKVDGSICFTLAHYVPNFDANGSVLGFFAFVNDVTFLKETDTRAKNAETRLRAIFDNVLEGIITINTKGIITSVNPATVNMFGYSYDEMVGQNVKMLMPEPNRSNHDGYITRYHSTGESQAIGVGRELEGLTKDGKLFPMELTVSDMTINEEQLFVGLLRDITDRKRAQDLLNMMATTDSLTGLANRRRFDEELSRQYVAHSRSAVELSLIMLDIDHFKAFNDTYGHVAGDDCIRQVAKIIRDAIPRLTDTAARYGGEEFACILPMTNSEEARKIAEKIREGICSLSIPHSNSSAAKYVTVSLGVISAKWVPASSEFDILKLADKQLPAVPLKCSKRDTL